MAPVTTVRNLEPATLARLRARAARHGRSLQAELRAILEAASVADLSDARAVANGVRRSLRGRITTDSGSSQAEDRRR